MDRVSRAVKQLPGPIKRAVCAVVPFRYRWNAEYRRTLDMLGATERWGRGSIEAYQRILLRRLIEHAFNNVPYYREVMHDRGLRPSDIRKPADLQKLPLLTKDIVREQGTRLWACSTCRTTAFSTSGSTGEPLTFVADESLLQTEAAFMTRAYRAHATRLYDEKIVWMRRYIPPEGAPIHRYVPEFGRHYLSASHLSRQTVGDYVRIINDTKARCLSTYPSAAYVLAMLMRHFGMRLEHVQVVHTTSELLLPKWRLMIESVIGPVHDHYSMAEKVSLFHTCPQSNGLYHENLEYGVTEIVDSEVVGTSLWNFAAPFIRYKTGDLVEPWAGDQRCPCGSGLPLTVKTFIGRSDDILVTPDGRHIPFVSAPIYKVQGVGMFQIVQKSPEHVEALIVPSPDFIMGWSGTLTRVLDSLRTQIGAGVRLTVRAVASLERDRTTDKIRCVTRRFPLT